MVVSLVDAIETCDCIERYSFIIETGAINHWTGDSSINLFASTSSELPEKKVQLKHKTLRSFNQVNQSTDHLVPFPWKIILPLLLRFRFPLICFNKMRPLFYSNGLSTNTRSQSPNIVFVVCSSRISYLHVFPNAAWRLFATISFFGFEARRHGTTVMLLHVREQETILIDIPRNKWAMCIQSITSRVTFFPLASSLHSQYHIRLVRIRRGSQDTIKDIVWVLLLFEFHP